MTTRATARVDFTRRLSVAAAGSGDARLREVNFTPVMSRHAATLHLGADACFAYGRETRRDVRQKGTRFVPYRTSVDFRSAVLGMMTIPSD